MRRPIAASVAAFGAFVLSGSIAVAQVHAGSSAPAAANSGQSRSLYTGSTPMGHMGYTGSNGSLNHPQCCVTDAGRGSHGQGSHPQASHHPHTRPYPVGGEVYAVPYPVYYGDLPPGNSDDEQAQDGPEDYAPGPTIFDRRGSSQPGSAAEAAYAERMTETQTREVPAGSSTEAGDRSPADPDVATPPQAMAPTVLVFKDGHQLEVQNYAIVGETLYDLTPGRRSKIALADLNLPATGKQNDDRGIDFQLPSAATAN